MANGRTDYEYYSRRMDWELFRDWVHHHFFEEAEEAEKEEEEPDEAEANVQGSEDEEDLVDPWETLVYNRGGAAVKDHGGK